MIFPGSMFSTSIKFVNKKHQKTRVKLKRQGLVRSPPHPPKLLRDPPATGPQKNGPLLVINGIMGVSPINSLISMNFLWGYFRGPYQLLSIGVMTWGDNPPHSVTAAFLKV